MSEQPRPVAVPATYTRKLTMVRPADGQIYRFDRAGQMRPLAVAPVLQPTPLGELIRARRLQLGWSQAKAAHELGISAENVSSLERKPQFMNCLTLVRYYTRLGIPINHLVDAILATAEDGGES